MLINNFMNYSSSPNLIKHFVPMNFSKDSVDYKKTTIKPKVKPTLENPFSNMKLQKLHSNPKDYVLIFKNKSSKTFRAKKKV